MASRQSLSLLLTFASVLFQICHGDGLRFTQHDYESRSQRALLNAISQFQIKKTDLFPELQTTENQPLVSDQNVDLKQCSCKGNTCGCCMRVKMNKIGLNADVCLKLSYLPKNIGVSVQLTVDGKVIFNKEISAKNPPPICAGVPGLKKIASVCIRLYDLSVSNKQFSGCVELQARLYKVITEKVKLGCFKIPPAVDVSSDSDEYFLVESDDQIQLEDTILSLLQKSEDNIVIDQFTDLKQCSCKENSCGCCMQVKMDKIGLNAKVCLTFSYLPKNLGVSVQITVDGKVIFKKEISAKNPPAVCAGVPGLKKMASLCVRFYDLSVSTKQFSGCVELQARLYKVIAEKVKLGCFKIPPTVDISSGEYFLVKEDSDQIQLGDAILPLLDQSGDSVDIGKVENLTSCSCQKDSCGCCMNIKMKLIHLHEDICIKVAYLPSEIGVEAELTMNGRIIFKEKVSASNPPPICAAVPGLKAFASLCLRFYDLHVSGRHLSGCMDIEARLYKIVVEKVELGCFKIPPSDNDVSFQNFLQGNDEVDQIIQTGGPMNLNGLEKSLMETIQDPEAGKCSCQKDSCECCAHVKVDKIHLDTNVCLKGSFLPKEQAIQIELTIDKKSIINKKIPAKTPPPPMCTAFKSFGKFCLKFSKLSISNQKLNGCASVEIILKKKIVQTVDLGCFQMPPMTEDIRSKIAQQMAEAFFQSLIEENTNLDSLLAIKDSDEFPHPDCSTAKDAYSCCLRFQAFSSKHSVCLKIVFIPRKLGVDLDLLFDGKVILHESIFVKDPPPICIPIPLIGKAAKVCIELTKLQIHTNGVSGCVTLEAELGNMVVKKFDLGCFKLPPATQYQISEDKPIFLDLP